jgi:uncharacterized protein
MAIKKNANILILLSTAFFMQLNAMEAPTQPRRAGKPTAALRFHTAYSLAQDIVSGKRQKSDLKKLPKELRTFAQLLIDNNLNLNEAFMDALINVDILYSSDDIQNLIEAGADVNLQDIYAQFLDKDTPLIYAIKTGLYWLVELLLKNGADPNLTNNFSDTPLSVAISLNRPDLIKLLLYNNANINQKVRSEPLLSIAVKKRYRDIVILLLKNNAQVNQANEILGITPLMQAIQANDISIVKIVLNAGANIDQQSFFGATALMMAAKSGNEKIINLLLEHGADINYSRGRYGETPLKCAISGGRNNIVKLLLDVGIKNINHRESNGETALMVAAEEGYFGIVKILLEYGADKTLINSGNTALDYAQLNGHQHIVQLLQAPELIPGEEQLKYFQSEE